MTLRVTCSLCGHLGSFFVIPTQPLEGAMDRAELLKKRHQCPNDPGGLLPTISIQQVP